MKALLRSLFALGFVSNSLVSYSQCDSSFAAYFTALDQGGNIAVFNGSSNLPANGFYWDFGDGDSGSGAFTQHFYQQPGSYYVCLTIWYWDQNTQDTCWASTCQTLVVGGFIDPCDSLLDASFNFTVNGALVDFTNQTSTSGYPANSYWDFGDGSYSYAENPPLQQYAQPGNYIVCLYSEIGPNNGNDSCFSAFCDTITIAGPGSICDSIPHNADFDFTVNGALVDFTNQTFTSGFDATYYWDFGNGTYSYSENPPLQQYTQPGNYLVCLYSAIGPNSGNDSCFSAFCDTVVVNIPGGGCDSTFNASYTYGLSSNIGFFTDQSNTAGQQVFYIWNFGDGSYDYSPDPIHTFAGPGQYYVCLDVWYWNQNTQDTCWSSYCEWVVVQGGVLDCDSVPHYADFDYFANTTWVNFYDLSITSGYNATYYWDFGDGNISTDPNPLHVYAQPGTYMVCLYTAIGINNGADSCFSAFCDTITIAGAGSVCDSIPHNADFDFSVNGTLVDFTNQTFTSGFDATYYWDFGDGSYSYAENPPLQQYAQPGDYLVCLYSAIGPNNGNDSCFSAFCDTIVVTSQNTSVSENILSMISLNPFPNPGNGAIQFSPEPSLKDLSLTVVDLQGRILIVYEQGALTEGVLDIRHLETGTYLFIFELDSSKRTERYILER